MALQDLLRKAQQSRIGKTISNVTSRIDRDKGMSGFQLVPGGASGARQRVQTSFRENPGSYNIFNQIKPTLIDPISSFKPRGAQMTLGEAVKQTAPNVVGDFGRTLSGSGTFIEKMPVLSNVAQMSARTGQSIGSGVMNIGAGLGQALDPSKNALQRLGGGGSKVLRGMGQVAAPGITPFQVANIGAEVGPSQTKRLASGALKGITQSQDLTGLAQSKKSLNIPMIGQVDPYEAVGEMIGFTQNPVNKRILQFTEKLMPTQKGPVKWFMSTASRGGLEDLLLNFDKVAEAKNPAKQMLNTMSEGALAELVGQGVISKTGKGFDFAINNKASQQLKQQLESAFEGLGQAKKQADNFIDVAPTADKPYGGLRTLAKSRLKQAQDALLPQEFMDAGGSQGGFARIGKSNDEELLNIYRGYDNNYTPKKGNYYSTDKEYAREFAFGAEDKNIINSNVKKSDVLIKDKLPRATSEEELTLAINEAKKNGYKAVMVDEGPGQANSVFFIEKTDNPSKTIAQQIKDRILPPEFMAEGGSQGGFVNFGADVNTKSKQLYEDIYKSTNPEETLFNINSYLDDIRLRGDKTDFQALKRALKQYKSDIVSGKGIPRHPELEKIFNVIEDVEVTNIKDFDNSIKDIQQQIEMARPDMEKMAIEENLQSFQQDVDLAKKTVKSFENNPGRFELMLEQKNPDLIEKLTILAQDPKYQVMYNQGESDDFVFRVIYGDIKAGKKVEPQFFGAENKQLEAEITPEMERLGLTPDDSQLQTQQALRDLQSNEQFIKTAPEITPELLAQPNKIKTTQALKSQSPEIVTAKAGTLEGQKKRKFIQTVIKSEEATPQMKEAAAKVDPQNYEVQSNVQAVSFADDFLKNNSVDDAKRFVIDSKKPDQNTTAVGLELMRKYQEEGSYDQAIEVLEALDKQGREAGRMVQSLSMWSRLSPEGMLRFAQKEFEKANERLTKFGRAELTPELAQQVTQRMKAIQRMADGPEKTKATKEVMNLISEQIPASASEWLDAYRYQNMLSGPNTQLRNIYGNFFQGGVLRPATIPFEVINDYVTASLTGKERSRYLNEVPKYLRTFYGSVPEAAQQFWQTMKGTDIDVKRLDLEIDRRKNLPAALTVVPRFMEGMDRFFSTMIKNAETARLMSTGLDQKQAEMEAGDLAEKLLFRSQLDPKNLSGQGTLLSGIDKTVSWIQKSPIPGTRWFLPFVSTPTNALKQLIEYSPGIGLAALPGNDKKSQLLAKQAMASIVALGGAQLAMTGNTTWAAPTDPKEKELFYASGRKPYSVRVGNMWVPMMYLGPLSGALALPAAVNYWNKESKTSLTDSQVKKLSKIAAAQVEFISQQSFLSNVGTMIDIMRGDIDKSVEGTLGFTTAQLIPASGFIRYINKMVDPVYRKASGFSESIQQNIPGATRSLEAYTLPDGSISTRDPLNLVMPFDLGKARDEYDLPLEQRREYNKQKSILNVAKKQLEAGGSSAKIQTSGVTTPAGLTTAQSRDFIKEKVKLGFDVPTEELESAFLQSALTMPKSNRYEEGQRKSKLFSELSSIESNEYLSQDQKDHLSGVIAKEVGLTTQDLETYKVAKGDNNEKTLFVLDQIDTFNSNDELMRFLVNGRKPVNGKTLVSDGVLKNLADDGIIPYQLYKDLKNLDLTETGAIKTSSKRSGSKKVKTVKPNFSKLANIKPFSSVKISTSSPIKANVSGLTFGS